MNITYMFGAGASANSIPILNNLPGSMSSMASIILNGLGETSPGFSSEFKDLTEEEKGSLIRFARSLKWLSNESSNHFTVDTFAKKLYFQGEKELLIKLKVTLSYFFFLKQHFEKSAFLDKRYISFLASILQKTSASGVKVPDNIKFISWNYDLQFELAYQSFMTDLSIKDVQTQIQAYPNSCRAEVLLTKDAQIVHLNGLAGFFETPDNKNSKWSISNIYHYYFYSEDMNDLIKKSIHFLTNVEDGKFDINYLFKFSWEKDNFINPLEKAISIAEETDVLVVIGYSFPFFNRQIDRQIISSLKPKAKIYYQDLDPDVNNLSQQFRYNLSLIEGVKNVKQFYFPPEL